MKKYTVTFTQYYTYEVEAEDEWEARDMAHRKFESDMYSPIVNPFYDEVEVECDEEDVMENKYNCDAYDSGYCYCLGRPLTDEEDDRCEDCCCATELNKDNNI